LFSPQFFEFRRIPTAIAPVSILTGFEDDRSHFVSARWLFPESAKTFATLSI